ncbi:hypothetical protein Leryth_015213 [Lithospermum erythrorhizon]|nr:hypothetical protein Leryth_015213 [Lithospermum erythrorhizon]
MVGDSNEGSPLTFEYTWQNMKNWITEQQKDPEKKPPSQASMYKETRKRKADNKYKTPFLAQ